jgi:hypothetical protein
MTQKSSLIVFSLFIPLLLLVFIFFLSSPMDHIQSDLATDAGIELASVQHYSFGTGGLVLLGQDKGGEGIIRAYTKFPIINRYTKTKAFSFNEADIPFNFAGESWAGYQVLMYKDAKLTVESEANGIGYTETLMLWFSLSCLGALAVTILLNRYYRQEGKPWWKK